MRLRPAPPLTSHAFRSMTNGTVRRLMSTQIRADLASFLGGRSRSCGIVGMPNVGKSTLFNALTNTQAAQAANYPFCTIEPNVGRVAIPDARLEALARLAGSAKVIGAQLEFVDIAGLVKGASEGAGLGNKFLGNIRQVSMILMLLRCFDDTDKDIITHVDGSVDPVRDLETIETELLLADIQTLTRRLGAGKNERKTVAAWSMASEVALVERILGVLDQGMPARDLMLSEEEALIFRHLQLLTGKPLLVACNVPESQVQGKDHTRAVAEFLSTREQASEAKKAGGLGAESSHVAAISVSCRLEEEVSMVADDVETRDNILREYGLQETGLNQVIHASNQMLALSTFYTVGPQEARAWPFAQGIAAPKAAGLIHSDFERGFIKAETISFQDFVAYGGEAEAREAGKLRLEGKDYVPQDGDIFHFKFNTTT